MTYEDQLGSIVNRIEYLETFINHKEKEIKYLAVTVEGAKQVLQDVRNDLDTLRRQMKQHS